MTWWAALRRRALAHPDIVATTAPYLTERAVFFDYRPQGSPMPALVMNIVADPREQHLKGFDGLRQTRVQLDAYAATAPAAEALAEAAITALVPHGEFSGVRFGRAMVANGPINLSAGTQDGVAVQAGNPISRRMVELIISHKGD